MTRITDCLHCRHPVVEHDLSGCGHNDPMALPQCQCPLGQVASRDAIAAAAVVAGLCQACGRKDHAHCAVIFCLCHGCQPLRAAAAELAAAAEALPRTSIQS